MKKCIIAAMDLNEINTRMDKAAARRKSFETNRSLSALVTIFIGYSFYKGMDEGAAIWFYIVMPLLIAIGIFLVVFDTKRINQAKAELEELRREKEALEPKIEEDADDDDDAELDDDADDGDDTGKIADDDDDAETEDDEAASESDDAAPESDAAGSDEKPGENE